MPTKEALEKRAKELEQVAKGRGLDWQRGAAKLPADDPVAKIGLLASLLDIHLGLALDPDSPLEEAMTSKEG